MGVFRLRRPCLSLVLTALALGLVLVAVTLGSHLVFESARSAAAAALPVELPVQATVMTSKVENDAHDGLEIAVSGWPSGAGWGRIAAQQPMTFTLTGLVLDCRGNPVEGVSVAIEGTIFVTTTNASGQYSLPTFELAAGSYVVTASKIGYGTRSQRVTLTEGDLAAGTKTVNFSSTQMCLQTVPASIFPGLRIQLPVLDTINCEVWIQVQNVADNWTKAIMLVWGPPTSCEPQAAGPIKVECTGLIAPGSSWSFKGNLLPAGSRSAVVYSMSTDAIINPIHGDPDIFADGVCERVFETVVSDDDDWRRFDMAFRNFGVWEGFDFGTHIGQPLAVTVNRDCPGDNTPGISVQAAYTGISEWMEGLYNPGAGSYAYYAPLIWATFGTPPRDWSSVIHIQNSGVACTSVEVWYQQQGDCARANIDDVLALAGGESTELDPNRVVGPNFQGSAWIRSSQPLGIIVEQVGMDMFMSYRAFPADVSSAGAVPPGGDLFTAGSLVNYAPLIYREFNGWDAGIQVQNLSSVINAKVRVQFSDVEGGVINTLTDWICPRGAQTFWLPAIYWPGYAFEYVGSARIESQDWGWPGGSPQDAPFVMSVVNLVKYKDSTRSEALEALSYNTFSEPEVFNWSLGDPNLGFPVIAIPFLAHATDEVGFGGPAATTEIAIQNVNPNPGSVTFEARIYDQAGFVDRVCGQLHSREVYYIDVDRWLIIQPGFLGSMIIRPTFWTHTPALAAVVVERVSRVLTDPDIPGDESKGFEGFPAAHVFEFDLTVCTP